MSPEKSSRRTESPTTSPLEVDVARRLRDAGARPSYVRRIVAELRDHRIEAADRPGDLESQLGEANAIVEAALRNPRALQVARRRPVLVFGLLPIVAIPISFSVVALLLVAVVEVLDFAFGFDVGDPARVPDAFYTVAIAYVTTARALLPPALAIGFWTLARRARLEGIWIAAAGLGLVAVAMATSFPFEVANGGREASLSLGVTDEGWLSRWRNGIPIVVALVFMGATEPLRRRARERSDPNAPLR